MNIGYEAKRIFHNKTGLGNYSRDLVRILSTFYPENNFFLYNPKKAKKELFKVNNVNVFERLPNSFFTKKLKNYWRQFKVVDELTKDNIQIFHGLSGEIPFGLKAKGIKSVVTIHDLIFVRYPELYSFWDKKIHFYKFKKATQNADLVIAISEQTKADIVTYLGINPSKIKVIYQGCQDAFKLDYSEKEKLEVKTKYNLPEKFLLNVGTIEKRKNILSTVKAFKDIDTTLVLVGKETDYSKEIRQFIKEHKIEHKVMFLKNVSNKELAIIYQLATIFIYPSIFEGFGIPIIEALFSKTPVITTNSGVFPEAGGPHSVYIEPNAIESQKEAILKLLNNVELRNSITEKSYEFVQKFRDEIIAEEIMNTYLELSRLKS